MMTWGGVWKTGAKSSLQMRMLLLLKQARFVILTLDLLMEDPGKEGVAGEHSGVTPNSDCVQRAGYDSEKARPVG